MLALISLGLSFTGCLFEPLHSSDSETNCSKRTWLITASFASGRQLSYKQLSGDSMRYQKTKAGDVMPVLTNIVAVSENSEPIKYSLSMYEIAKLRNAHYGEIRLVIYDDGIACLPPRVIVQSDNHQQTQKEYIQFLANEKNEAVKWTQDVLNARQ